MNLTEATTSFFLAVVVILLTCRIVGWLVGRVGQPQVVGEMIAGVVLGPSVVGLISPSAQAHLFPQDIRPLLYVVGQLGLVLFMFEAGYEFRTERIRQLARSAGAISAAGVGVPLLLGSTLTFALSGSVHIFVPGVSIGVSALFVGVALAITAFPMLARIITERGIADSRYGSLALASGALDDAVAWLLLAVVLSIAAERIRPFALAAGGGVLFVLLMVTVGRRFLAWAVARRWSSPQHLLLATAAVLFLAAWYTDRIGLYAVFGAFSVGVAMPRVAATDQMLTSIGPLTKIVLLPLFFTYSGLNTEFGLLKSPAVLGFAVLCVIAAIIGKFGACWAAARLVGESPAVASRLGALMNARGLMQLIALNVGLQAGIVTPSLFSVLVVVAIVTTVMATPCLDWFERRAARAGGRVDVPEAGGSPELVTG